MRMCRKSDREYLSGHCVTTFSPVHNPTQGLAGLTRGFQSCPNRRAYCRSSVGTELPGEPAWCDATS
eukprot:scaffold568373_cov22-Prasinocladus_malaysianus.AAC.1